MPFARINELKRGDIVTLETPEGTFNYVVTGPFDKHSNPWVTHPLDWTVIAQIDAPVLTLTTADPPHTSKNRLIVRLELVPDDFYQGYGKGR